MMIRLSFAAIALFIAISLNSASSSEQRRMLLQPNESIVTHVRRAKAQKQKMGFTITAEVSDDTSNLFGGSPSELVYLDVIEASPAITSDTIVENGGRRSRVDIDSIHTILVSDTSTLEGSETFTLLAIDPQTDKVHGIVEKKGSKAFKIKQKKGDKTIATEEDEANMLAPDWSCGVGNDEEIGGRRLKEEDHEHHDVSKVHMSFQSRCLNSY
jgi:hypothetical protein